MPAAASQTADAPRFHHQYLPNGREAEEHFPAGPTDVLAASGYHVVRMGALDEKTTGVWGDSERIYVYPATGELLGWQDRGHHFGKAAGYQVYILMIAIGYECATKEFMNRLRCVFSPITTVAMLSISFTSPAQTITPADAPIRVAVYQDEGSEKAATFFDENVGKDKAHFILTHVTATQIRDGALKEYDVVIQGGGGSRAQAEALQPAGREAIREFVRNGGGYLGVCAGAYLAASDKDYQLGILNARVIDREHWARGRGDVVLDFSKAGQQELKFFHDKATVLYHQGPLLAPNDTSSLPAYTPVALFETEVAQKGAPHGVMQGTTAMASGNFGKGRVFVISPHPEQTPGLDGLVRQAVAWVANRDVPVEIVK